jgi:hypothetical protein
MENDHIVYIAGFFDGEGSVTLTRPRASKNGKRYLKLRVRIAQKSRSVLYWIRRTLGMGCVVVDRDRRSKKGCSHYCLADRQAERFLDLMLPYLRVKKAGAKRALREISDARGRPPMKW